MKKYLIRLIIGSIIFGVFIFLEMYLKNDVSILVSTCVGAFSGILFGVLFYLISPVFNRMIGKRNKEQE